MAKRKKKAEIAPLHDSHPGPCDLEAHAELDAQLAEQREGDRAVLEPPAPAVLGDQLLIPGVEPEPEPARSWPIYAFPTKSRCPRCGSDQTERTSGHGDTQYRQCRVAVCRKRYPVIGKLI